MLESLLRTPAMLMLIVAAVVLLVSLWLLASCRGAWRRRRRASATGRAAFGLLALALALTLGALGTLLLGYVRMTQDTQVAHLAIEQLGTQRYAVALTDGSGRTRRYELAGDEWQLDARIVRWTTPGVLAGLPPLYRLERLSGRYGDIKQEREATRTLYALNESAIPDLWSLRRQYPGIVPFVDADYGSAAYLPLLDGAEYDVSLAQRGGLVARAHDDETRRLLEAAGW